MATSSDRRAVFINIVIDEYSKIPRCKVGGSTLSPESLYRALAVSDSLLINVKILSYDKTVPRSKSMWASDLDLITGYSFIVV